MPAQRANIQYENQVFLLSGTLDFSNAQQIYQKSLSDCGKAAKLLFNLSQVKSIDSSGLALMLEWIKLAKRQNKSIQFQHIPENLLTIAKIAGIDVLIQK